MLGLRLLVAVALLGPLCRAAQPSLPPELAEALGELEVLGDRLASGPTRPAPGAWKRRARRLLRRIERSEALANSTVRVAELEPAAELLLELRGWASSGSELPKARDFRLWLRRLRRQLTSTQRLGRAPPARESLNARRRQLSRILRQRAYAEPARGGASLRARVAELVARYVLEPLLGSSRRSAARKVLLVVCLALLALLVGHVLWELWALFRRGRAQSQRAWFRSPVSAVQALGEPAELLARGDRALGAGQPLRAMGLYYMAALCHLASAGCTRLDRSLTNWEHYRRARGSGRLGEEALERLRQLNALFDEHCYGGARPSEESVKRFRTLVVELAGAR